MAIPIAATPCAGGTRFTSRIAAFQAAHFAEDIHPPAEAITWSDEKLDTWFETGGLLGEKPQNKRLLASLKEGSNPFPGPWPKFYMKNCHKVQDITPCAGGKGYEIPPYHYGPLQSVSSQSGAKGLVKGKGWDADACGVVIRRCNHSHKGLGAFAASCVHGHTGPESCGIFARKGMLVGVYAGELLSTEGFRRRHESRWCEKHEPGRKERLAALTHGAPIGGHFNGGSYVVALASAPGIGMAMAEGPEDVFVYIDAEDPNRSSWCRYINHAEANERECNLILQTSADQDAPGAWLIARRDIWVGEELLFDYGPRYELPRSDMFSSYNCEACGYACICGCG